MTARFLALVFTTASTTKTRESDAGVSGKGRPMSFGSRVHATIHAAFHS